MAVAIVAFGSEIVCCMSDFQEKLVCFTSAKYPDLGHGEGKGKLVRTGEGSRSCLTPNKGTIKSGTAATVPGTFHQPELKKCGFCLTSVLLKCLL